MPHSNSITLAILLSFCLVAIETRQSIEDRFVNRLKGRQDTDEKGRTKRAGFVPVMTGYRVWKAILRNSRKTKITGSDDAYEQLHYTRKGGYLRALEDFYSMKPEDVRFFHKENNAFGNVGIIGERTVVIQGKVIKGVPSLPILRVFKTHKDGLDDAEPIITYSQ